MILMFDLIVIGAALGGAMQVDLPYTLAEERYAPFTDELKEICNEISGFKAYRSVKSVDGFFTASEQGCRHSCRLWLLRDGFSSVEAKMSEKRWADIRRRSKSYADKFLVDGPGWFRFSQVNWGDPGGSKYEGYLRARNSDLAVLNDRLAGEGMSDEKLEIARVESRYGEYVGKSIAVEKLDKPVARYGRIPRPIDVRAINQGAILVSIVGEQVIDSANGDVLGETVAVYARIRKLSSNGELEATASQRYCGVQTLSNGQFLSILSPK